MALTPRDCAKATTALRRSLVLAAFRMRGRISLLRGFMGVLWHKKYILQVGGGMGCNFIANGYHRDVGKHQLFLGDGKHETSNLCCTGLLGHAVI